MKQLIPSLHPCALTPSQPPPPQLNPPPASIPPPDTRILINRVTAPRFAFFTQSHGATVRCARWFRHFFGKLKKDVAQGRTSRKYGGGGEKKNMTRGRDKKLSASVFSCLVLIYI